MQLLILCAPVWFSSSRLNQTCAPFPSRRAFAQFLGQPLGIIERGGAADIMFQQIVELRLERRVGLGGAIFALQIKHQRHQRFGDIAPAILAEMAAFVRLVAEGIGFGFGHASLR